MAAVVDFPSDGPVDVTTIVSMDESMLANWMFVRIVRYCSATGDFGS
ncbi:hypothetical protein HNQ41_002788 [Texcoconibacillus texcoconensis]|uniref:Uncharacterized protein n=1 Tax=Texcoconibacillus texcoconensis TaxID=1095777 RepID=A0A840QTF7_9BACI|nr:hypothetical protein [Texcoconibacillus texcoconensis]